MRSKLFILKFSNPIQNASNIQSNTPNPTFNQTHPFVYRIFTTFFVEFHKLKHKTLLNRSVKTVDKEILRFETVLREERRPGRSAFAVTDSKGRYHQRCLEHRDYIQFIWRGGARIGWEKTLFSVVFNWLGTCDLTKIGARKRISLRGMEFP